MLPPTTPPVSAPALGRKVIRGDDTGKTSGMGDAFKGIPLPRTGTGPLPSATRRPASIRARPNWGASVTQATSTQASSSKLSTPLRRMTEAMLPPASVSEVTNPCSKSSVQSPAMVLSIPRRPSDETPSTTPQSSGRVPSLSRPSRSKP
jgi:hypothetical protein